MELQRTSSNRSFSLNPNHATVSFKCKFHTQLGQQMRIVGNIEELGCWEPTKSMLMTTNKDNYPMWESDGKITAPVGMEIIYKYLFYNKDKNDYYWEDLKEETNRRFTIPSSGVFILYDEEGSSKCYVQKSGGTVADNYDYFGSIERDSYINLEDEMDKKLGDEDPEAFMCLSYDANQINSSEKPFFFCMNQKISADDRIIIASALLPFEIDKTPDDNFLIRVTDESLIYSILYGMKEKEVCDVLWVGMLKNASQFCGTDLEKIKEFLRDRNIYMILPTELDYKNYRIYMNQILGDVFIESTIDIHK